MKNIKSYVLPQEVSTLNSDISTLTPSKTILAPNGDQNPVERKSKSKIWQTLILLLILTFTPIPNCGNHQPQLVIQPQLIIHGENNIDIQIPLIKVEKNNYQTNNY